jgi:hypothetical protein
MISKTDRKVIMNYEEFKAMIAKAFEMDVDTETLWKLSRLSRDMDEFRQNFALASDKDMDDDFEDGEGEE